MPFEALLISERDLQSNITEAFAEANRGTVTWSTLISSSKTPTDSLCAGIVSCPPRGGTLEPHCHEQAEIYYVLEGDGEVTVAGDTYAVHPGSMLYIPGAAVHSVHNLGSTELRWLYFFAASDFRSIVYRFQNEDGQPAGKLS